MIPEQNSNGVSSLAVEHADALEDAALPSYSTTRIVNDDGLLVASLKRLHCRVLKVVEHVDPLTGSIAVEMVAAEAAAAVEMVEGVAVDSVAAVDAVLLDDGDGMVASEHLDDAGSAASWDDAADDDDRRDGCQEVTVGAAKGDVLVA